MDNIDARIKKLEEEIKLLKQRRVYQQDIVPDVVKQRQVGEGVRFIRDGAASSKPTIGEEPIQGAASFFDYTNNKLWIWNRSTNAWKSVTLS